MNWNPSMRRRAWLLAAADKDAGSVLTSSRRRGHFGLPRDTTVQILLLELHR